MASPTGAASKIMNKRDAVIIGAVGVLGFAVGLV